MKKLVKKAIKRVAPSITETLSRLARIEQKLNETRNFMDTRAGQVHDFRIDKLKTALKRAEPYQPAYSVAGVLEDPRRQSIDRARAIELYLGQTAGLRILDIGSSLGYMCYYFSDRGAVAEGWDMRPENVEVAQLIGEINGVPATFKTKQLNTDTVQTIPQDHFDVVLLLSVLHHTVYYNGLEYTQKLLRTLLERVPTLVVELAKRDEDKKLFWNDAQPKDPLALFDLVKDEVSIKQIGSFHNHLSEQTRPLYIIRRKNVVTVNNRHYTFRTKTSEAYSRSPMVFSRSLRRYYLGDEHIIKEYDFQNETDNENKRQIVSEINTLLHVQGIYHQPELVDFEITPAHARVVLKNVRGALLSDKLESDEVLPMVAICQEVLKSLRDLRAKDLYHNDVRGWNIIVRGKKAYLIDYGLVSHRQIDDDIVSLLWVIHAMITGERQSYQQNKPLPKRQPFTAQPELLVLYDAIKKGERNPATLLALLP